ncbi:MAG TPA: GTPase HflX [Kofleriaceae bacterium]|jgi:GTP-binding protein HflX|nr:GTPase HflX [Kofleriaceae bacterium]
MTIDGGSLFDRLGERPPAVVVAVQLPGVTDGELASSIAELERLAKTLGLDPIARIVQRRAKLAPGIVLGEGKLKELAGWTGGTGDVPTFESSVARAKRLEEEALEEEEPEPETTEAPAQKAKVVLIDHDLTPTQQTNLEKATGVDVLDRTSVILEIFHRHAKTREARLQVEIARLKYLAPRLRESGGGGDRVRGGIGGKGAGESTLELDRRRIRDRVAELKDELSRIEGGAKTRRDRRSELPTVALVGYTNAGKSSLMRALTSTDVYIADKLFATLDTTVRRLVPATDPPILVTDTVGFIKKLPHDLVASFRSTLDEAKDADLLLHMVDASDAAHADQLAVTREVLAEIGADELPTWLLLNKIDRVDEAERAKLADKYPTALQLSAKRPADVSALHEKLVEHFIGALEEAELDVPWSHQRLVHVIHERTTVLAETHHDDGTRVRLRAPSGIVEELRNQLKGDAR